MNEEFLKNISAVHFIGIGGIGVSAIARLMLARGISVTGSDRENSVIIEKLEEEGAKIFIGHNATQLPDGCNLVVYSPAIKNDNPELVSAQAYGIQALSYPEALGKISSGMRTIAISGTHGKTTTTAMISEILIGVHLLPTVIVGSLLKKTGSNFVLGASNLFVVEACEYQRSFMNLTPEILVITNIDNDHMDYYGNIEGVQKAFAEFVEKVPVSGVIVCDPNDSFVTPILARASARIVDYTKENLTTPLSVSGEHNIKNAKAALAVAQVFGIAGEVANRVLGGFQGTWRRMEFKGKTKGGVLVYDDYAHHPTEVRASLQGFRSKYPTKHICVVFQPHLYSRTKLLLNEFAQSFGDADEVFVAPIYAARETLDPSISTEIFVQEISKYHGCVRECSDFSEIETYLCDTLVSRDVVVTMGAGDVFKIGEQFVSM